MEVELKIHNGGSIKALRLTKAEILINHPSKKYCISHITIILYEVDIDNNSELNAKLKIQTLPTVYLIYNNSVYDNLKGLN